MRLGSVSALGGLLAYCVMCPPHAARAQLDMTGPWATRGVVLFGPTFDCPLDVVQTGSALALSGTCALVGSIAATGVIDPMTGSFSGSGTTSPLCPTLSLTAGTAALDGTTFFVQFACSGGPLVVAGSLQGFRCGNGVIEAGLGENCDDGNRDDGDCCSSTCHADPPGATCLPIDDNQCTDDVCDGAGTCMHPNRSGTCDDGNQCTSGDACVDGACVATVLPDGSACDDANDCTTELCQGGACVIENQPDGTPCNDFYDCTVSEACLAGQCQIGLSRVCPACERCSEGDGCLPEENTGRPCRYTATDLLQLEKTRVDAMKWKWVADQSLVPADFGDPTTATGYELCVFDSNSSDPVTGRPRLLFAAGAAAGSTWRRKARGFAFKGADTLTLKLKAGAAGRARIVVQAKGPAHPVRYLPPFDTPVSVYLRTADGVADDICFASSYSTWETSSAKQFTARSP